MNALEKEIMERALRGDHPLRASLRIQLVSSSMQEREFTGTGFMTVFSLPVQVARASSRDRVIIGDVAAEVSGLPLGAGFLLFVTGGILDALEGYSYDAT
jgi:hypothetical protein